MTANTLIQEPQHPGSPKWWRFGYVWLVIAGPVLVVIAAVFTAILAFNSKDVIVSDNDPRTTALANYRSLVPAQTASYHAATPDAGLLAARARAAGALTPLVSSTPSPAANPTPTSPSREPIQ